MKLKNCRRLRPLAGLMLAVLTACGTPSMPQTAPSVTPLDTALATPCEELTPPEKQDYDAWLSWTIGVLEKYAGCAVRHQMTVAAWPKE